MRKMFLLFIIFSIMMCDKQKMTEMEIKEESLYSFVLRNYEGSHLIWKLIAGDAKISDTTIIHQLELEFYDENSNITSWLRADSGYVINELNDLKVMGNIIVKSSDSVILWTEELNWSEERQKIFTDGKVKYSRGNDIYFGKGLESDASLKRIIIKEKFSGQGEFK
jgi:LPS export ABC transporter protein LptC